MQTTQNRRCRDPDARPGKVYDGQPSKAVLTVTAGSEAQKAEIMAGSVLVYSKDGQPVEECIDQGTYTATASFSAAVLESMIWPAWMPRAM